MSKALIFYMKRILFAFFLLLAGSVVAQTRTYLDAADKAFANKDYYTAAYYYSKTLKGDSVSAHSTVPYFSIREQKLNTQEVANVTYQLAECYRLYHNFIMAQPNYEQVAQSNGSDYPLARLWYAVCLRTNGHVDEAVKQVTLFITENKDNRTNEALGERELANCRFAEAQLKRPTATKATKMAEGLNGTAGDYALSINNNTYWFTSSRTVNANGNEVNQIYRANGGNPSTVSRVYFDNSLGNDVQYGTPSLDSTGTRMYLTVWYTQDGQRLAQIYLSKFDGVKWTDPQKLGNMVNYGSYNAMQPFVTADGKRLFYASDKPGGLGGTDIWVSDLDKQGQPLNANNMGSSVNTPDDEQAPFYSERDRRLVYSSKGFTGMGGFDLFESFYKNDEWTTAVNLGAPFNSVKDDLYYYQDRHNADKVFFSSDRETDCCLNLFEVQTLSELSFSGVVIDCASSSPLSNVKITLIDSLSKQTVSVINTTNRGRYTFKVVTNHPYILRLEKPSYFTKVMSIPGIKTSKSDTLFNPTICAFEYHINKPIIIQNILYDFNKATLRPESKTILDGLVEMLVDNPRIKIELSSHTDNMGPDWFNKKLSLARAQSCVDYVISKGIDKSRIIAKGYGASEPIAPNKLPDGRDNPAGRQLNRRTEFKVLKD